MSANPPPANDPSFCIRSITNDELQELTSYSALHRHCFLKQENPETAALHDAFNDFCFNEVTRRNEEARQLQHMYDTGRNTIDPTQQAPHDLEKYLYDLGDSDLERFIRYTVRKKDHFATNRNKEMETLYESFVSLAVNERTRREEEEHQRFII